MVNYMFWTGGWDSTFMLIQELRKGKTIQPIYVIDEGRKGSNKELEAMNKISQKINSSNLKGELLNILTINKKEIIITEEVSNSYDSLNKKLKLGSQYEWLAALSKKYGQISMGIEKPNGEYSGCVEAISKFGGFKDIDENTVIDTDKSNDDVINLFQNIDFPIIHLTEVEMLELVKEWNVTEIMKEIWFCHNPIKQKPCGLCRPCEQKMECNMEFLLPKESQNRFHKMKKIEKMFGKKVSSLYKKIVRKINK